MPGIEHTHIYIYFLEGGGRGKGGISSLKLAQQTSSNYQNYALKFRSCFRPNVKSAMSTLIFRSKARKKPVKRNLLRFHVGVVWNVIRLHPLTLGGGGVTFPKYKTLYYWLNAPIWNCVDRLNETNNCCVKRDLRVSLSSQSEGLYPGLPP